MTWAEVIAANAARRRHGRRVRAEIRRRWPDVYICPGLGWCGPGWEAAAAYETAHAWEGP